MINVHILHYVFIFMIINYFCLSLSFGLMKMIQFSNSTQGIVSGKYLDLVEIVNELRLVNNFEKLIHG